jgi:hypothetical protein
MTTENPGAGELNLPQAFLLLATNDKDGEPEVPQSVLRAGLSGAILAELDLLGAIQLQGKYVRATGAPPQSDFQHQWELIHDKSRPHSPGDGLSCWKAVPNCTASMRAWRLSAS